MSWSIFWSINSAVCAGLVLGLVGYAGWLRAKRLSSRQVRTLHNYGRSVGFWAFWGAVFGSLGAALLMKFTGLVLAEALPWILFGTVGGLIWGALWGLVWQITSR